MTVRVHSGWRRAVARGAMLGLVFQAFVSAFMLPMPAAGTAAARNNSICAPAAFKQAADDAGGAPPGSGQPAGKTCAVCTVLAAVASFALLPALQPLPLESPVPFIGQPATGRLLFHAAVFTQHNRGPPHQA
jgi:hypothetical protein